MPLRIFAWALLLIPSLLFSVEPRDIPLVQSFLENPTGESENADSVSSSELRLVLREILLQEMVSKGMLKEVKKEFPEHEKGFDNAVSRVLSGTQDTAFVSYFIRTGYALENKSYYRKKVNTKSKASVAEYICKYPDDDFSRQFIFFAKDSLSKDAAQNFLLKNMGREGFKEWCDSLPAVQGAEFLRALKAGDTSAVKSEIDANMPLFMKTDKKYKIMYASFLNDSLSDKTVLYFKGRGEEEKGNYERATMLFAESGDEEALLRALARIKNGTKSSEFADSVLLRYPASTTPFLYHKAKLLLSSGMKREGDSILEGISASFPYDLYSIRSFLYLNRKFSLPEGSRECDSLLLSLYGVFEKYDSKEYFNRLLFRLFESGKITNRDAAIVSDSLGITNIAIHFAEKTRGEKMDMALFEATYPVRFIEIFKAASEKFNVELPLLLAIAREESSFKADAVSSAGAMGIMQLMGFTYDSYYSDRDYFNPEKNIYAGARHIAEYMKDFPYNPSEGIMSYNAGKGNVKKWKRQYADWELHLEMVPFIETKNYVKRVLRSYFVYKFIIKVS